MHTNGRGRFSPRWRLALGLCAAVLFGEIDGAAQARRTAASHVAPATNGAAVQAVSTDTTDALVQMASQASIIFTGQVEAVARNDASGYVDVRFRIEQALRGCPQSGVYVLREWAGLWVGQADRYHVGQRLLMLLPRRGPSGMSAPIGGMDGAIPIVATGTQPIANVAGVAPADDGSGANPAASVGVDLRWIAAHVLRVAGTTSAAAPRVVNGGAIGKPIASPVDTASEGWSGPVAPLNAAGSGSGGVAVTANLSGIITLLRGSGNGPH